MVKKELLFITVIGKDSKGIVANVSMLLFKQNINILDVSQKVIEGFFVMSMLVDVKDASVSMEKLRILLERLGEKMKLKIQVQHSNVFNAMHRI